jgi:hypothetical protein
MRVEKITTGFAKLSDGDFEKKATSIVTSMTGNDNFTKPVPALATVSSAIDDYSSALAAAQTRDRVQIAIKTEKRNALTAILRNLAAYVSFTANGNKSVMVSSGFDLAKEPVSAGPMQVPANFKAGIGTNVGQAVTTVSRVAGVKAYNHQCTADPLTLTSVWAGNYSTLRTFTFEGLDSGKKYWFRVEVIGKNGQVVYTDPVAVIIQ